MTYTVDFTVASNNEAAHRIFTRNGKISENSDPPDSHAALLKRFIADHPIARIEDADGSATITYRVTVSAPAYVSNGDIRMLATTTSFAGLRDDQDPLMEMIVVNHDRTKQSIILTASERYGPPESIEVKSRIHLIPRLVA